MIRRISLIAALGLGTMTQAQDIEVTPLDPVDPDAVVEQSLPEDKAIIPTESVGQAVLRGIDKLDGLAQNLIVGSDFPRRFGLLDIELKECRYPADNPSGEAFAYLTIKEDGTVVFSGWMIASSPALNALDHQRFDVWVLRCRTSSTDGGAE